MAEWRQEGLSKRECGSDGVGVGGGASEIKDLPKRNCGE